MAVFASRSRLVEQVTDLSDITEPGELTPYYAIRLPKFVPFVFGWAVTLGAAIILATNLIVVNDARGRTFDSADRLPANEAGLLLGTSKYSGRGVLNPFFENRIAAAVELYELGRVRIIIASGDNGELSYNEPIEMKRELLKRGIPESQVYLDYAGFSTLDSIIRIHRVFGQSRLTVISQKFQNERAIFIANHYGIDVVGFNARDVSGPLAFRVHVREVFARVKAYLDVFVLHTQPRYLGKPVKVRDRPPGVTPSDE